jgi:hypothetical protein
MLRIALPQLCGALGAAEVPCPFIHRLSGPVYLCGSIAIGPVTYLHQKRHKCQLKVVQTIVALACYVRTGEAEPAPSISAQPHRTLGKQAKRYSASLGRVGVPERFDRDDRQNPACRGEPRKASQKRTRRAGSIPTRLTPQWSLGDRVAWGRIGSFVRDLNDGIHAEIRIEQRVYRVKIADLRPG